MPGWCVRGAQGRPRLGPVSCCVPPLLFCFLFPTRPSHWVCRVVPSWFSLFVLARTSLYVVSVTLVHMLQIHVFVFCFKAEILPNLISWFIRSFSKLAAWATKGVCCLNTQIVDIAPT